MMNTTLSLDEGTGAFFESFDGLRLHARRWERRDKAHRLPVVCLAGLTRSSLDFAPLAKALTGGDAPRRVVALDYRGRGLSDHDPAGSYDLATERNDILRVLDALGIGRAHFIGTSRGGLHLMGLAADHRARMASAVLNDIGPVLERAGLQRIKSYIGRQATPRSLDEAVRLMKFGDVATGFDGLGADEWRHFARTTFGPDESDLRLRYDPRLARALDEIDLTRPMPDLWPTFDQLRPVPVLAIRGANSDLLSHETLEVMGARWPGNRVHVVPGQAHAPLLADAPTIGAITDFLEGAEVEQADATPRAYGGAPQP